MGREATSYGRSLAPHLRLEPRCGAERSIVDGTSNECELKKKILAMNYSMFLFRIIWNIRWLILNGMPVHCFAKKTICQFYDFSTVIVI